MKTTILLFCAFLSLLRAQAQLSSSCVPSATLVAAYGDDVKDLAVRRIIDLQGPDTIFVAIPQLYQDTIMAGLAAIYNTGGLLEADSVFAAHCIHQFPYGNINTGFLVTVDTTYAWTHAWESLTAITGNPVVDSLVSKYGFTVTHYYPGPGALSNIAVIRTTHAINSRAFVDSLGAISGVFRIEVDGGVGDHNYITYKRGSIDTFTFSLGWSDCPSGCINRKNWVYTVDNSCNVSLAAVNTILWSPYPEPAPLNCAPMAGAVPQVKTTQVISVYPNPCIEVLHVVAGRTGSYRLTDNCGRAIGAGQVDGNGATLDMQQVPAGIYVMRLVGADGAVNYCKVIRQ